MRLQVAIAALAALVLTDTALAGTRAATWVSVYTDDDHLTVVSPVLNVRGNVTDELQVDVGYDVDVITAASVDVVTAASPRGYDESRHGFALGATYKPRPETTLGLRYIPSFEPDYESHGVSTTVGNEWIDRRLTTALTYRVTFDSIGRIGDARDRWRSASEHAIGVSVGWVFDRRTIGDLAYELDLREGFMASPYRFVPVTWDDSELMTVYVPEAVPDRRVSHAIGLGLRRAFTATWFARYNYRLYFDTWGILSHTGSVAVEHAFPGDRLVVGLHARAYNQSAADFYRRRYYAPVGTAPRYRAADKMLSESWSVLTTARGEYDLGPIGPFEVFAVTVKAGIYYQRFLNFEPLTSRRGLIFSLGIAAEL